MENPDRRAASAVGTLAFVTAGPLMWAAQFTVAYGGVTLACAVWGSSWAAYVTVAGSALAASALAIFYALFARRIAPLFGLTPEVIRERRLVKAGQAIALLSIVAILWTGSAMALVDACQQGR